MTILLLILKRAVLVLAFATATQVAAQEAEADLDDLFGALQQAEGDAVAAIEQRIYREWSRSGSPAMDLLLERGRDAMEEQAWDLAIGHFSALTDHAPDFAEGWNARATAFYQVGRYGPALADIRQALALNPRHFGALTGLAVVLERIGRNEMALEAWREVEKLSPNREGLDETLRRLERATLGQTL